MKLRTILFLCGILALLAVVALLTGRAERKRLSPGASARLLPRVEAAKVTRFDVTRRGTTTTLELKDGAWKVEPHDLPADDDAIRKALALLEKLGRGEVAAENPAKHELLEVKEGQATAVAVSVFADPKDGPTAEILIGKTGGDFQSNFVRLKGESRVYRSQELIRPAFDRDATAWADRNVLRFEPDDAVKVELAPREGASLVIERKAHGDPWRITAPTPGPANTTLVDGMVGNLSMLRADDFATLYDAATTGLGHPSRSAVTLKDGRTLEAQWGKEAPSSRVYVQTKDGGVIYQVALATMNAVFPDPEKLRAPQPGPATAGPSPSQAHGPAGAAPVQTP